MPPTARAPERGRIHHWDAAKGLGFVEAASDGDRLLLRQADLTGRLRFQTPKVGEAVLFVRSGQGGAWRATRVRPQAPPPAPPPRAARSGRSAPRSATPASQRLLVLPVFAALLGALHIAWPLPRVVPLLYGALSTALFIVYGLDKWAAIKGRARVAEASLHAIALLGGWPGALLGQQIFRHKTAKPAFLRWTWAMVALNLLLLIGLCTPAWVPLWHWLMARWG